MFNPGPTAKGYQLIMPLSSITLESYVSLRSLLSPCPLSFFSFHHPIRHSPQRISLSPATLEAHSHLSLQESPCIAWLFSFSSPLFKNLLYLCLFTWGNWLSNLCQSVHVEAANPTSFQHGPFGGKWASNKKTKPMSKMSCFVASNGDGGGDFFVSFYS